MSRTEVMHPAERQTRKRLEDRCWAMLAVGWLEELLLSSSQIGTVSTQSSWQRLHKVNHAQVPMRAMLGASWGHAFIRCCCAWCRKKTSQPVSLIHGPVLAFHAQTVVQS